MHQPLMTTAIGPLGKNHIVTIKDVQSGLGCNCSCADRGTPLVAKKGKKKAHHFAHAPNIETAQNCEWSPETDIHLMAKYIIEKDKKVLLPIGTIEPISRWFELDSVLLEAREGTRIPDVIAICEGEKLLIEIAVTHYCDKQKISELKAQKLNCIEIAIDTYLLPEGGLVTEDWARNVLEDASSKWLSLFCSGVFGSLCHRADAEKLLAIKSEYMGIKPALDSLRIQKRELSAYVFKIGKKIETLSSESAEIQQRNTSAREEYHKLRTEIHAGHDVINMIKNHRAVIDQKQQDAWRELEHWKRNASNEINLKAENERTALVREREDFSQEIAIANQKIFEREAKLRQADSMLKEAEEKLSAANSRGKELDSRMTRIEALEAELEKTISRRANEVAQTRYNALCYEKDSYLKRLIRQIDEAKKDGREAKRKYSSFSYKAQKLKL